MAATNRSIEDRIASGHFREDLYFRLKVVTIRLPPLCERTGDISLLIDYFLPRFASEVGIDNPGITDEAKTRMVSYPWPGNVRELANVLQKVLIFNRGAPIGVEEIVKAISGEIPVRTDDREGSEREIRQWIRQELSSGEKGDLFDSCMDHFANILISEALNLTNGNRSQAARLLGLSRPTLHSKIEKYGIKLETSVKED